MFEKQQPKRAEDIIRCFMAPSNIATTLDSLANARKAFLKQPLREVKVIRRFAKGKELTS